MEPERYSHLGVYRDSKGGYMLNPLWHVAFMAGMAALVVFARLPEKSGAFMAIMYSAAITVLSPLNGIIFITMISPLALCEQWREYAWLYEVFAWIVIAGGLWRAALKGPFPGAAAFHTIMLFVLAAAASLPLDAKEFVYDVWANSPDEIAAWYISAHPGPKTRYFRLLANLMANAGLALIAAHYLQSRKDELIVKWLKSYAIVVAAVSFAALVFIGGEGTERSSSLMSKVAGAAAEINAMVAPHWESGPRYLTMSLVGKMESGAIAAFSYNTQFYVQWCITTIPLLVALTISLSKTSRIQALLVMILVTVLAAQSYQTGQRSMYLSLLILAGIYIAGLAGLPSRLSLQTAKRLAAVAVLAAVGLIAWKVNSAGGLGKTLVDIQGFIKDSSYYMLRYQVWEPRLFLWHTAASMAVASPILGVGLGRYSALFGEYFNGSYTVWEDIGFASGSAHSLYFEMLAEQGFLGIGLFLLISLAAITAGIRYYLRPNDGAPDPARHLALGLALSCVMWLILGGSHDMRIVRALDGNYWIYIGMIFGLTTSAAPPMPQGRNRLTRGVLIILFPALLFQVYHVWARPIARGYSAGFHNWEQNEKGEAYRWMGKRGVFLPSTDATLLKVFAPIPNVEANPQKLSIRYGEERQTVVIADYGWHEIVLKKAPGASADQLIFIKASRVFNPKKEGASQDERDLSAMVVVKPWTQ